MQLELLLRVYGPFAWKDAAILFHCNDTVVLQALHNSIEIKVSKNIFSQKKFNQLYRIIISSKLLFESSNFARARRISVSNTAKVVRFSRNKRKWTKRNQFDDETNNVETPSRVVWRTLRNPREFKQNCKLSHRQARYAAQQTRLTLSYGRNRRLFFPISPTSRVHRGPGVRGGRWMNARAAKGMLNRVVNSLAFHSVPKQSQVIRCRRRRRRRRERKRNLELFERGRVEGLEGWCTSGRRIGGLISL